MTHVALLDYGMGNLRSVEKALERVGARVERTRDLDLIRSAGGAVLPGVGAFPKAMEEVRRLGMDAALADRISAGRPVLGVCLGLQLLFESSTEGGGARGLGFLEGSVERMPASGLKVPHIGWAEVRWEKSSRLLDGVPSETPFYFVHSFVPQPARAEDVLGTAVYAERFACAAERWPVAGAQFHPEKSSAAGLALLRNFAAICAPAPA